MNALSGAAFSGDTNDDGLLDAGEMWKWEFSSGQLSVTTTIIATGNGTDPYGNEITYPTYPDERDEATVAVILPTSD